MEDDAFWNWLEVRVLTMTTTNEEQAPTGRTPEVDKKSPGPLMTGVYDVTPAFRSIEKHAAICEEDGRLIAVCGPADDPRSVETAEAFVLAVNAGDSLLARISALEKALEKIASGGHHSECGVEDQDCGCADRFAKEALSLTREKENGK